MGTRAEAQRLWTIIVLLLAQTVLASSSSSSWTGAPLVVRHVHVCCSNSSGLQMRANKKKSKPVAPPSGGGGARKGEGANKEAAAAPSAAPLRIDPKLGAVRQQMKWVAMKKEYALRHQQGYRREKTKYRRQNDEEPEYVEEIDLSKVKITTVLPTLLVDGYNIIMFW
jgi:hypothetical protein